MSERSVIEHALTVYYDGNAKLAGQIIDLYRDFVAHELAERQRDAAHIVRPVGLEAEDAVRVSAALIDPEASDG
jgi:hypothetical protein